MFRILLVLMLTLAYTGLGAQNIDYVHPRKASFQHSLICTVFKAIGLKKDKENRGPDNYYTQKKPLKKLYAKHKIREEMIEGKTVFHISQQNKPGGLHVIYLHGGAYTANFMKQHWGFISRLITENNVSVLAPDYPLAPESDWKKNIHFVLLCYQSLLKTVSAENIVFMGDSAGGGLSLALAMAARDAGLAQPGQIIMLAPWLDLTMENPEIVTLEKRDPMLNLKTVKKAAMSYAADSNSLRNPYVSPIFGNLEQLAPMSIFIGGRDVLKADTDKFRAKCTGTGMPINYYFYPKMMHVWMLAPFLPESKKVFLQIGKLLDSNPNIFSHEKR